jgi:lysophospholipase L1-like esterase
MQKPFASRMLSHAARLVVGLAVGCLASATAPARATDTLPGLEKVHRVVFVGDSITFDGEYVDNIQTCVLMRFPKTQVEFINVGQSSETVSGLSEPGFAKDKFTRPDLHTRLAAILEKTKPDLVVTSYGMNDGIYQPFDEAHFKKFQDGMSWLHETVVKSGAKVLHITPSLFDYPVLKAKVLDSGAKGMTPFDPAYDDVLDRYSKWMVEQRRQGWDVVDVHGTMRQMVAERRKTDPAYTLTRDGIHPSATGNWLIAREILLHWGAPAEIGRMDSIEPVLTNSPQGNGLIELIRQQEHVLRDAWLTEAGHLYPGHKKGLPLPEAQKRAAELDEKIHSLEGLK